MKAPGLNFPRFTAVFPCAFPRMIRPSLARGGMCAALGIRRVAMGPIIFGAFLALLASLGAPLGLHFGVS